MRRARPGAGASAPTTLDKVRSAMGGGSVPPRRPPPSGEEDDDDGMLRMSFMEHLEELRSRIFKALIGVAVGPDAQRAAQLQVPVQRVKRLQARQTLRERKADEAYQEWLRQLRDQTYVELRLDER